MHAARSIANGGNVSKMKYRLENIRLKARMKDIRQRLYLSERQKEDIMTELRENLEESDFKWLEKVVDDSGQKDSIKVKERQIRKYKGLLDEKKKN